MRLRQYLLTLRVFLLLFGYKQTHTHTPCVHIHVRVREEESSCLSEELSKRVFLGKKPPRVYLDNITRKTDRETDRDRENRNKCPLTRRASRSST